MKGKKKGFMMKKGFSLVEMLVVMGIIAVLVGAGLAGYTASTRKAQKSRGQELVNNVATALELIYQEDGCWPRRILAEGQSDGELTPEIAYDLAKRKKMTLTIDTQNEQNHRTVGIDRMGVVTPWATAVIKRAGTGSVGDSTKVSTGGTIKDHRLHFAVDTEGRGYVRASVGGESVEIRGAAAVWCCGMDGKLEPYSKGLRSDDIYSWGRGQVRK